MKPLSNEITVQCNHCFGMINTTISELQDENRLSCHHCFHVQTIDVEKLVRGLIELMKKVNDKKAVNSEKRKVNS